MKSSCKNVCYSTLVLHWYTEKEEKSDKNLKYFYELYKRVVSQLTCLASWAGLRKRLHTRENWRTRNRRAIVAPIIRAPYFLEL